MKIGIMSGFPGVSTRLYDAYLFSDEGLRIQRFNNELFIAHPTRQFNWDVKQIRFIEGSQDSYIFAFGYNPIHLNDHVIVYADGNVSKGHNRLLLKINPEDYHNFKNFIINILK